MCPGSVATRAIQARHRGVALEVEAALPGHVRVAVERDVGDAQALADEVVAILAEVASPAPPSAL